MTVAPFGSWSSPISAARLVEEAVSLGQVAVDGADVYWSEARPTEGGRQVVVRWAHGAGGAGKPVDVLPAGFSARSTVHEYGGASFAVRHGVVWFSNYEDQRVYRLVPGRAPEPVTAEAPSPRAVRFADFDVSPDGRVLAAVRERHLDSGEVIDDLVVLAADGPAGATEPEVVAEGRDFFAAPRWSPGGRLAWLAWDLPDMPWDGTELWVREVTGADRLVAGGRDESISQPRWGPDENLCSHVLYWASDRTGWWSLYRGGEPGGEPVATGEAEHSGPDWIFGQSTYAVLPCGSLVAARAAGGLAELTVDGRTAATPFSSFSSVQPYGADSIVAVAGSPQEAPAVVRIALDGRVTTLGRSRPATVDRAYLSTPEPVTFATDAGQEAHALFYRPTNPDFKGPPGELPPLVVTCHGGPTSAARPELNLALQYLTSRGLAVVEVDYRGSSGYGRAYRRALDGQWGVADVADCVNAARHLAATGHVDGHRLAIRGSSAGGFTTLCALAFHRTFAVGASWYGVADLASLATGTHKFESGYLERLVGPWPESAEIYRARSPIHHAGRVSAPVILFQGLEDKVVPPSQSEVMVRALQDNGVPHAYVTFEGEQHGFRKAGTIVRAAEAELWFYGQVLGFEPADDIEPVPIANWPTPTPTNW